MVHSHYFTANGEREGGLSSPGMLSPRGWEQGPSKVMTQVDRGLRRPHCSLVVTVQGEEKQKGSVFLSANFGLLTSKEMDDLVTGQSPSADTFGLPFKKISILIRVNTHILHV